MDYEKCYRVALERAETIYSGKYKPEIAAWAKENLEVIFPELAESEDKRIRKAITSVINFSDDSNMFYSKNNVTQEQCIAWLEKQDDIIASYEDKLDRCACESFDKGYKAAIEKQGEQNPTNKVEPKFKVGDWITFNGGKPFKILKVESEQNGILDYLLVFQDGHDFYCNKKYVDENARLWTIQDAKDGDILHHSDTASNSTFIFKNIEPCGKIERVRCYCEYDSEDYFGLERISCYTSNKFIYPATKEQRDLLFQKMKEAGYEWDSEKKELKKEIIGPKFKVGDWVVFNDVPESMYQITSVYQIEKIENFQYTLRHILGGSMPLSFSNEEMIRLWTIADAKDGDVLQLGTVTAIFKKYIGQEKCLCYCSVSDNEFEIPIENNDYNVYGCIDAHPATKEQHDALERAITNAGYRWDAKNKELKKIGSKFHEGDWITIDKPCQIISINDNGNYIVQYCDDEKTHIISKKFCESYLHLWTIEDAKPGDVLAAHECYVIFKEIDGLNIKCYCTYHYMNNPSFHVDTLQNKDAFHPATKEQRDILFSKMKDMGYGWNADEKEIV